MSKDPMDMIKDPKTKALWEEAKMAAFKEVVECGLLPGPKNRIKWEMSDHLKKPAIDIDKINTLLVRKGFRYGVFKVEQFSAPQIPSVATVSVDVMPSPLFLDHLEDILDHLETVGYGVSTVFMMMGEDDPKCWRAMVWETRKIKRNYLKVKFIESGTYYIVSMAESSSILEEFQEGEIGSKWEIEIIEMTDKDYNEMKEFEGH